MSLIKNAAPQVIFHGTDDKSARTIPVANEPIPTHLPLFYIFAEKGPTARTLVSSDKLATLYGTKTSDQNEKFFTHQTLFLQAVLGQTNTCMVHRLIPPDAGVKANAVIYLDVLKTKVPNYVRDSYGGYVTDPETGDKKVYDNKPWIDGHKIKFIRETLTKEQEMGILKPKTGTMVLRTKYQDTIPDAKQVSLINFKNKYKIDDLINLDLPGLTEGVDYEVTIGSTNIIDRNQDGQLYAKSTGKTSLTIKILNVDEPYIIKLNPNVVSTDVNEAGSVIATDLTRILTPNELTTEVGIETEDVAAAVITSGSPSIVKANGIQLTALDNGVAMVYITIPATADKESVTSVYSVQSKAPGLPEREEVVSSIMYPIFEVKAKYQGAYYNNLGFTLASVFEEDSSPTFMEATKSLMYKLYLYTRADEKSSPVIFKNLNGEQYCNISLEEKCINPETDERHDLEYVFANSLFNETNSLSPFKPFEYENIYFYRSIYKDVVSKLMALEREYVREENEEWADGDLATTKSWFDFTTVDQEKLLEEGLLLNVFLQRSTKNVPYFTVMREDSVFDKTDTQEEILVHGDTPIFLAGGQDGTTSNENFEQLVYNEIEKYNDVDSNIQDLAINVESIFYDSGFSLDLKKQLCKFISVRPDTALILSTYIWNKRGKQQTISEMRSIGQALKKTLKSYPESAFYGTPVARGVVVMGGGVLRGDQDTTYKSPAYEIAIKAAKMMGNKNGIWDTTAMFDNYPGNSIDYLIDIYPDHIPASLRPNVWTDQLVWIQPYDLHTHHFPAIQTVYDNDTSVLNNFFVMMALCEIVKIGDRVWRKYTGTSGMNDETFLNAVTAYATTLVNGKFGSLVTVIPSATMKEIDKLRGYSWNLTFKIYGENMKTVMTLTTETYRSSDLEASS